MKKYVVNLPRDTDFLKWVTPMFKIFYYEAFTKQYMDFINLPNGLIRYFFIGERL